MIRPPARTDSIRSGSGAACGSSNSAARPGRANQDDSPVSHSETSTPLATATAATVKACEHRSGASAPAVTLITSFWFGICRTVITPGQHAFTRWPPHGSAARPIHPAPFAEQLRLIPIARAATGGVPHREGRPPTH